MLWFQASETLLVLLSSLYSIPCLHLLKKIVPSACYHCCLDHWEETLLSGLSGQASPSWILEIQIVTICFSFL